MESNTSKNDKNDFSYLVGMALWNRMPWNILAFNFNSLPLTLYETREIIGILLKELEALQSTLEKKEKLLEKYESVSDSVEGNEMVKEKFSVTLIETEKKCPWRS